MRVVDHGREQTGDDHFVLEIEWPRLRQIELVEYDQQRDEEYSVDFLDDVEAALEDVECQIVRQHECNHVHVEDLFRVAEVFVRTVDSIENGFDEWNFLVAIGENAMGFLEEMTNVTVFCGWCLGEAQVGFVIDMLDGLLRHVASFLAATVEQMVRFADEQVGETVADVGETEIVGSIFEDANDGRVDVELLERGLRVVAMDRSGEIRIGR